jgi:hypothetical protein
LIRSQEEGAVQMQEDADEVKAQMAKQHEFDKARAREIFTLNKLQGPVKEHNAQVAKGTDPVSCHS